MKDRLAELKRKTGETDISIFLNLDGSGETEVDTGIGFLDHLFVSLSKHAGFDLKLSCKGDLIIDDHHSAEDCAIALGTAFDKALGERKGIARFGYAYAPLDEALARAIVDISSRPFADIELGLQRDSIGKLASENVSHVLTSFAFAARLTLHVDMLKGGNDHHMAEAAFKALALALAMAIEHKGKATPSTKGVL